MSQSSRQNRKVVAKRNRRGSRRPAAGRPLRLEQLERREVMTATLGFTGDYVLENWTKELISDGTTTIAPNSGAADEATFGYDMTLNSGGFSRERTVDFLNTAAETGSVTFDYEFTGNSKFFRARALFDSVSGSGATPVLDESTSGNFSLSGSASFIAQQGENLGFRIGGGNSDSNRDINGELRITNIVFHDEIFDPLVVDTLSDLDDGDISAGNLSLREAVRLANEAAGADTILFDPSLAGGTITLTGGQLDITDEVTITGLGADQLTISGGGASRIFGSVGTHDVTIEDLTLTDGSAIGARGGAALVDGGFLTLTRSVVQNSIADFGSAIDVFQGRLQLFDSSIVSNPGANSAIRLVDSFGGIEGSTISSNQGVGVRFDSTANNGIEQVIFLDSTIVGNDGGGFFNDGGLGVELFYQGSIFADNGGAGSFGQPSDIIVRLFLSTGFNLLDDTPQGAAAHPAAATDIRNTDPVLGSLQNNGGTTPTHAPLVGSPAIDAGFSLSPTDQIGAPRIFDQPDVPNAPGGNGSDIGAVERPATETPSFVVTTDLDVVSDIDGRTSLREAILLANATPGLDTITFDASLAGSTILLSEGQLELRSSITINGLGAKDLTISGGGVSRVFSEEGGGQRIINITDLTIADGMGSSADRGGGFFSVGGDVTFERVVMTGNASGGNEGSTIVMAFGTLKIIDSAIVGNLPNGVGAIRLQDMQTTITNTTLSGNATRGISVFNTNSTDDRLTLDSVTIADNSNEGIEVVAFGASTTLLEYSNTLFANNGGQGSIDARGNDAGLPGLSIVSLGHNLLDDAPAGDAVHNAAAGDIRNGNADLQPLADNGGPTPTHALGEDSDALDAGNSQLATDQRGVGRPADLLFAANAPGSNGSDIGAFESYGAALVLPGDYNLDGVVNAIDYAVWREQFGQTDVITGAGADGNRDGAITGADFDIWRDNFGATTPAPAAIEQAPAATPLTNDEANDAASDEPDNVTNDLAFALLDQDASDPAPSPAPLPGIASFAAANAPEDLLLLALSEPLQSEADRALAEVTLSAAPQQAVDAARELDLALDIL